MSLRFSEQEYEDYLKRQGKSLLTPVSNISEGEQVKPLPKRGKPNKTETEYGNRIRYEFGIEPKFEALTFRFDNGHSYTPDWVVQTGKEIICYEVKARGKNGFRLPSYQRAKLAFDQAKVEYPQFVWIWAEKYQGEWITK